jgi:hypothetical protein
MIERHKTGRRKMISSLGLGLATMAIPQMVSASPQYKKVSPAPSLEDPTTKYPRPPFKSQSQAWPGLAGKMEPRPDHGEKSYKGSNRLAGRKALITGGDSGMGRAAAIAYAREGADVVINYLPAEESDAREVIDLIREAGRKVLPFLAIFVKKISVKD